MHLHSEVIGEKSKLLPFSAKPSLAIGSSKLFVSPTPQTDLIVYLLFSILGSLSRQMLPVSQLYKCCV